MDGAHRPYRAPPPPDPREERDVQEFAALRSALRTMAAELEEGRRQAVQSARLRSWTEMARRVAHELKNPLTPMRMAAATVARLDAPGAAAAGEVLLEEIARLDEMARTFAQFGRMPEEPPSEVDVEELARGLVEEHRGMGVQLHLEADADLPRIQAHHEALRRALRNVLLNAVEAAGEGGEVWVRLESEGEGVAVEVRDSGPGIPPDALERIWEPDFTTKRRGTGLGLPIVRQTVETAHGGRVEARNHPEGGALFRLVLPREIPVRESSGAPEPK